MLRASLGSLSLVPDSDETLRHVVYAATADGRRFEIVVPNRDADQLYEPAARLPGAGGGRMALRDLLHADTETPERAEGKVATDSILRSYAALRTGVGILGTAWPILLLLVDAFFLSSSPSARGSISAYYYSGMRDVFVGVLFAIAPLLITYKLFEANRDNLLSSIAGVAAVLVAVFPTGRPSADVKLTPIQDRLGEAWVQRIHFASTGIFVVCLAFICWEFASREYKRPRNRVSGPTRFSPHAWAAFHRGMAILIFVALGFIAVTTLLQVFGHYRLLIGETVICIAFGLSWLTKGIELDVLRPGKSATSEALGQDGRRGL